MNEKAIKRSRVLYVLEASFEYLISILVASSFLATLTSELGMSDSMTGIISSIISLGCVFQLFSMAVSRKTVKSFVIIMSISNQLLFTALYVIPVINLSPSLKRIIFFIAIVSAYFIYNMAHPKKINWLMSLIEDGKRGRFTALKEMTSLVMGMGFTLGMGAIIDAYKAKGDIRTALIISAAVIFLLMVIHTLTMIFSVEKESPAPKDTNIINKFLSVVRDKNVLRVTVLFILWQLASYSTIPFYGTYQIKELGMSLTFVSLITIMGNIARAVASPFLGSFADKYSFPEMIKICFGIMCVGFAAGVLAVPRTGSIMFMTYNICHGIALAGINSSLTNLVFDCVPPEKRADSLAISQAVSGLAGFLATLIISRLVEYVQKNGNRIFGISIYAQQLTSLIALLLTVTALVYVCVFFKDHKRSA